MSSVCFLAHANERPTPGRERHFQVEYCKPFPSFACSHLWPLPFIIAFCPNQASMPNQKQAAVLFKSAMRLSISNSHPHLYTDFPTDAEIWTLPCLVTSLLFLVFFHARGRNRAISTGTSTIFQMQEVVKWLVIIIATNMLSLTVSFDHFQKLDGTDLILQQWHQLINFELYLINSNSKSCLRYYWACYKRQI